MNARIFTTSIRLYDAIMYNEQLELAFIDGHKLSVNPVAFGFLNDKLFVEAFYREKVYLFDFNFIDTANNLPANKDYKTTSTLLTEPIFTRQYK